MAKTRADSGRNPALATRDDVIGILGNVDPEKMLAILELQPSVADVEDALLWLGGDRDVFGAEPPIKGAASRIVTILTEEEEEEAARAG
jgi:hypothetical protein